MMKAIGLTGWICAWCAAAAVAQPAAWRAVALLAPVEGQLAAGRLEFMQSGMAVQIVGRVQGLTPNALHGFHVHEKGDCSAGGRAAGGHFNPMERPHGGPTAPEHHAGDLGNIRADANGVAVLDLQTADFQLEGPHSIVGRAVVVHVFTDDLVTQPSGQSGPPMACGVIERTQ